MLSFCILVHQIKTYMRHFAKNKFKLCLVERKLFLRGIIPLLHKEGQLLKKKCLRKNLLQYDNKD